MQKLLVQRRQGLTAAVRFVRGARLIVRTRVLDRWSLDAGGGLKREPVSARVRLRRTALYPNLHWLPSNSC